MKRARVGTMEASSSGNGVSKIDAVKTERDVAVGDSRTKLKLMILLLIPVIGFIAMAVVIVSGSASSYSGARVASNSIAQSLAVSNLVKSLQVERGLTAMYISTGKINLKTFKELESKRRIVNADLERMTEWMTVTIGNVTFAERDRFHQYLIDYRRTLPHNSITIEASLTFYTDITQNLVRTIATEVDLTSKGVLWQKFVALNALLQAGDAVGIERALGASYFARCRLSTENRNWVRRLNAKSRSNRAQAFTYQPSAKMAFDDALEKATPLDNIINSLKDEIIGDKPASCHSLSMVERVDQGLYWFYNVTIYINILNNVRENVATTLLDELYSVISDSRMKLIIYCILLVFITLMSLSLFWGVHRLTDEIHSYSLTVARTSKELEVEKKKADELFGPMLPRTIAVQVKSNIKVKPEHFESVTVSFSEVNQITNHTTGCSSHQVVSFLDELYSLFDKIVANYDVYKFETAAMPMLIASGLPETNGKQHAFQVAVVAQSMIDAVSKVTLPHRSWEKLELRVGIHSGSCVAGVVGTRLPRYMLFGDLLSTASHLQAEGSGSKIHISESTKTLLSRSKGYDTELKGTIAVDGKRQVMTYWLTIKKETT